LAKVRADCETNSLVLESSFHSAKQQVIAAFEFEHRSRMSREDLVYVHDPDAVDLCSTSFIEFFRSNRMLEEVLAADPDGRRERLES